MEKTIAIHYTPNQIERLLRSLADAPYKMVADIIGTTAKQADEAQAAELAENGKPAGEIIEKVAGGDPPAK